MDRHSPTLIVGHGPSLKGKGRGKEIDLLTVVRFGDGLYWQTPEDYGTRTDYILTIDQNVADLLNNRVVPKETWVFGRPGVRDEEFILERIKRFNPHICTETDPWLKRFKEIGAKGYCSRRFPDDPHFSQGLAAIIMAAERLHTDILLGGFDNLLSGSNDGFKSFAAHDGFNTFHDFEAEHKLMREIESHYGVRVIGWI